MKHIIPISGFTAPNWEIEREIVNTGAKYIEIRVVDPRDISRDQRRKAWAIVGDISRWSGHPPGWIHEMLKLDHCIKEDKELFSLSSCSVTDAREYISYLIDFCVYHNVPLKKGISELCDDLELALYSCLAHKRCVVCGKKPDLHHVDKVGMGRDRRAIIHKGMAVQPLCRMHHTECHNMGQQSFDSKYHLIAYELDDYLCKQYGLKYEAD